MRAQGASSSPYELTLLKTSTSSYWQHDGKEALLWLRDEYVHKNKPASILGALIWTYQFRFGLFIPPKFLNNFQFYLDSLIYSRINSRINSKLYQYVLKLYVLGSRVYILAYDFDLHSVLVELGHEKTCLMSYANNKGADQPAHPRSPISAFVIRCLDSIISLDFIAEISKLWLASVAVQAGLCLAWSETPEDTFCRVVAQFF